MGGRAAVRLAEWEADDLALLEKLNSEEMTAHLGGPESIEKVAARHARYLQPATQMFKIVDEATLEAVGSVGYWDRDWLGEEVYEVGWGVLPEFQGCGFATAATGLVVEKARADGRHRYVHAYPSVDNEASNGICRKLGFARLGACEFEYPPGSIMRCNDWQLDLLAA